MMKKIIFIMACLLLIATASAATVSSSSASIYYPGMGSYSNTGSSAIILDSAPAGLSGCNITVTNSNTSVITMTAFSYPSWAQMTINTTMPSSSVTWSEADTNSLEQAGATNIPLGYINFKAVANGTATLTVTITECDDDSGSGISPAISSGTITVSGSPVGVLPHRADATTTVAPISTNGYVMLVTAVGGNTSNDNATINWSGVVQSVATPETDLMGPIAWFLAFSLPMLMLYIAQGKAWIPLILGIMIGASALALGWIPAVYAPIVWLFAILATAGILISLYVGRKI